MNKIIIVLVFAVAITGCASTRTATVSGDGSSYETAVVANNVSGEYEWIREHYPGSQVEMQSLSQNGKKYYDVITIQLQDGSKKAVYFDINKFYGRGF